MIPKAELHVHIEGAMKSTLARKLAEKNGVTLPVGFIGANGQYQWEGFFGFIEGYDRVADLIKSPEDAREVITAYLMDSAAEGVIYNEIIISPSHFAMQGMNYQDMLGVAVDSIDAVRKKTGLVSRLLIAAVRHEGVDKVEKTIQLMLDNPHPYVVGVNLAGDEINFPPKLFEASFKAVHDAGYGVVVHAGETRGPESVWETLEYLPVDRLGHGVRAIEDPKLIEEIKKRDLTLEVCPSSNICIGVFPSYSAHPLRKLYDAGVKVTLNSDDPYFFDTTIGHEYEIAEKQFGFTESELIGVTRTAIENSFVDQETKRVLESYARHC